MGQDPVQICAYFASRDRINHVHFRNVKVTKPYERYSEVCIDEGENNMFLVMKELVKHKYAREIYPEHPRASTTTAIAAASAAIRAAAGMRLRVPGRLYARHVAAALMSV